MATEQNGNSRYFALASIWVGAFLCCALAMAYFYGSLGSGVIYPLRTHFEEGVAVAPTALFAALLFSWAIWFGAKGTHSFWRILLRTGFATQATLTLYAIAGCQGILGGDWHLVISGWRVSSNLVFPSTFFAEYNWLTFIFEVGPVTSISASLLLYLYFWGKSRIQGRVAHPCAASPRKGGIAL